MFEGVPAWKKKLIKQKLDSRATQEAAMMEAEGERRDKLAAIAAMPEWRKKIFLEKNPQYKTQL